MMRRLRRLFHKQTAEKQLDAELRYHVERQIADYVAAGMSLQEAGRRARMELGGIEHLKEESREARSMYFVEGLLQDLRFGVRMLWKNPGFTAVAVLTLALGIGANTAIFSLLDAILLRTLPVSHPESLVVLASYSRDGRVGDFGYSDYQVLRDGNRAFSGMLAASNQAQIEVGIDAETDVAIRKIVSCDYFSVLGVQPILGRMFGDEDENVPVAVISFGYWKRSFAGSASVVGKQIDLDGSAFTIVGVASPDFFGETVGDAPDIWATMSLMPASRRSLPGYTWLNLMGRLKPGLRAQQASQDLSVLEAQIGNSDSRGGFIQRIAVESGDRGGSGLRDSFSAPLNILMAVVAVVLLIACANLASLQLARATTRQREIATRLALGAGHGRIVRQLVTESVLLSLMGGMVGFVFSIWTERFLLGLVAGVGRAITLDLHPDVHVLGFTGLISVATGVVFGLAPALQAARQSHGVGLNPNLSFQAGRRRLLNLKDGLVVMQVALSVVLVVAGGLLIRTMQNLRTQDIGFHAANVLSVQVSSDRGHEPPTVSNLVQLLQRLEAIPGVQVGSFSFSPTLSGAGSGVEGLKFEGHPQTAESQRAQANWVGPDYFQTAGIPIIEGREFSTADNANTQKSAILNLTMARHYFGDRSAVGKRFEFNKVQYTIIGVAKDAKYVDLRKSNVPFVYFAAMQNNSEIHSLELRTTSAPLALAGAVKDAIREVDPQLRIREVTTLEKRMDQKLAKESLVADLAGFFSGLTLLLVFVGIYGTLAYMVARRTNEIGIRMALGARKSDVLQLVVGQGLALALAGLAVGIVGALGLTRFLTSLLYGVKPSDAITLAAASVTLIGVTLLASYVPARRAMKVDPMVALRYE
ncbi:MAG TPA: ABC transporter permease [Candidatus Acidoferrales bacterium]|nr:ABC transporter permease [Candidatus Acidoferrales bacterium]